MTAMTPANNPYLSLPLEGVRLIEASAGTGKTFTLATLFTRLVVERGLRIGQILAVTFTEAATQELRKRIRERLLLAASLALIAAVLLAFVPRLPTADTSNGGASLASGTVRITSGSDPKSCSETTPSSGWTRSISSRVRRLPCARAKLETISETARPAPWRFAWRRTNQLPIPASGASRTRFGIRTSPI